MAVRGPKGGAAREAWRAEEGMKESLLEGFSPAEWAEALQMIGSVEQTGRARTASVMGRGGGAFDPKAFARATAPLAGGTQKAIGGLHAAEARMKRQGMMQWLQILQRRAAQEQERRARSRAGVTSGMASMFGFGTQMMQAGGRGVAPTAGTPDDWNIAAGPIQTPTYPAGPTTDISSEIAGQPSRVSPTRLGLSPIWDWMGSQ